MTTNHPQPGAVLVPRAELEDFRDVMGNLIAELSDPGTGALAARYRIDQMLDAHLSEAAPARGGRTVGPVDIERLRSLIHSATHHVLPFAEKPMKPFSTKERAGMQVEICDLVISGLGNAIAAPSNPDPRPEQGEVAVPDELTERLTKVAYSTEFLDVREDILALIERDGRRWLDNIAVCELLADARAKLDTHLRDRPRR